MELKAEQITRAIKILEGARVIVANRDFDNFQDAIITAINALNQVKELTEENERLHASCTELTRKMQDNVRAKARIDAVAEFAKRINEKLFSVPTVYNSHFSRMVDAVEKEMLEGERQ